MSGPKLRVGIIFMGIAVPLVLFYLLHLEDLRQLLIISGVTFAVWCLADLAGEILSRPRLKDRGPRDAIRDWETQKQDPAEPRKKD